MEFLQAFCPWIVVVGNVETKTAVGCIHQQLANHDKRAQFIYEGLLVIGQTAAKRQSQICKYVQIQNIYASVAMQYEKIMSTFKVKGTSVSFNLHERAASGSHQAENWESVNDEAQLFVGQQGVDENETHCGQQQKPHAPVKKTKGDKEERAAQGSGQCRVKVPQKGCGLLGGKRSR